MQHVKIGILGSLHLEVDGSEVTLAGRREQMLLARLALSPDETLSKDALIDAMWGEQLPANPGNALQAAVSRLRKAVGKDQIATRPPGYALAVPPDAVDAHRFESLLGRAEAAPEPSSRVEILREALDLWRGRPLGAFSDEEFAQPEIRRLDALHQRSMELLIESRIATGEDAAVLPDLERLIADDPLRENLRRLHMLALYRAGRQADALAVYQEVRRVLGDELGIDPGPELQELELDILQQAPDIARQAAAGATFGERPPHNLPERLTSFIGREREVTAVIDALADSRLVTLLGPGGAGKTSLAIEAGRAAADAYRHGVWLVELASVASGEPVAALAEAVANATGVASGRGFGLGNDAEDPVEALVAGLRDRRMLLVLDNCEHVVAAAAALVSRILQSGPSVDVVATSRERLGVPGEMVRIVPPLAIGDPARQPSPAVAQSDAVRLFVERARAVNAAFDLDEAGLGHVLTICRRLDGLPLAVELAAARTSLLPVAEIAARLDDVFRLLAGGARTAEERHQALRATIQWSHELLSAAERSVFDRLSVFRGRFDLSAAAAVVGMDELDLIDVLQRLVDQSMVVAELGDRPSYRLLETLRAFAVEQLIASGDAELTHRRHFDHFHDVVVDAEPHLRTERQLAVLEELDGVLDNARAALDWSAEHDPRAGVALVGALGWYLYLRGHRAEARARAARLLEAAGDDIAPADRGRAMFIHAMSDPSGVGAAAELRAASAQFDRAGDRWFAALTAAVAAAFSASGTGLSQAVAATDEAARVMDELDDDWGRGLVEFMRANVAVAGNDLTAAVEHASRAHACFVATGDTWGVGYLEYFRGINERALGNYAAAEAAFRDALDLALVVGLRQEAPIIMAELANLATLQGEYASADALLDRARRAADDIGATNARAMVRNARGLWWRRQGRPRNARELHVAAARIYADLDMTGGVAYSEGSAGRAAHDMGDLEAARAHERRSLRAATAVNDHMAIAFALEGSGGLAIASGDTERGVTLLGAADAIRSGLGVPLPPGEDFDVRRWEASAREDLPSGAVDAALAAGAALDLDAAIATAEVVLGDPSGTSE